MPYYGGHLRDFRFPLPLRVIKCAFKMWPENGGLNLRVDLGVNELKINTKLKVSVE